MTKKVLPDNGKMRLPFSESRMIRDIHDFELALDMFNSCGETEVKKPILLLKLIDTAETFEEALEAYRCSLPKKDFEDRAYSKMESIDPERTDYLFG